MNPLTKDVQEILNRDCLADAEHITGESYKTSEATSHLGMAMHMRHNQEKRDVLAFNRDAHFGTTLEEYIQIVTELGFVKLLECPFSQKRFGEVMNCKQFVFWEHKRGILLHFDTYWTGVNSGNYYFNWQRVKDFPGHLPFSGRYLDREGFNQMALIGSLDCREGIRHYINMLDEHGEWIAPWIERPWLWLLTWADTKDEARDTDKYDYEAINESVIARLPETVRKIITPDKVTTK